MTLTTSATTDVRLRPALRTLIALPWAAKAWIARHPAAWRVYSGACRRLGWDRNSLGWHTSPNGPFAGIRVEALHTNHLWAAAGLYEPAVATALIALLRDPRFAGAEVWDVGAHRGLISLLVARHGASRVLAIELSPTNVALLDRELTANAALASRIEILNAAASDADGEIEVVINAEDGAVCQIAGPGVRQYERTPATSVARAVSRTLDSIAAGRSGRIGVLKIDVEGAEALVLAGARQVLHAHRPAVVLEVHNEDADRRSVDLLIGAGYTCRRLSSDGSLLPIHEVTRHGHVLARPER